MACMLTNPQMMRATFGSCMNAASSCAISAAVDAIFVASIIIVFCGLIRGLICLPILGISLVAMAILGIYGKMDSVRAQEPF